MPLITKTPIARSIGGKAEKIGIFVKRRAETKLTAAIVNVPVTNPTIRYKGRYIGLRALKPSNSERPVTAVKRVPTKRKGYLNKLVSKIRPTSAKPNLAPAVVDDIKCEPPIQAAAKIIPGPKDFSIPFFESVIIE